MSSILVKLFATALTLSQVTVQPDDIRTSFDRDGDRAKVVQLLQDGCAHMRRAFDIEDINLDELIATAMEDPQAVAGDVKVLQGISFGELHTAYKQYCKGEEAGASPVQIGEVIEYYNAAMADLPDHARLKDMKLPGMSVILDGSGKPFADVHEPDNRRVWVPLSAIPASVQKAFVAAEDKRFYEHRGIDERGIIRAFIGNLADPSRPQGGSTITQQVAKNLLVGDDVTYERKMREMVVAARMERSLSKAEILEIYLNAIYLGRSSWGIEMAARSWFGRSAEALTMPQGALLAALTKGPNYYDPLRYPDRAEERYAYVLNRMREDGAITAEEARSALANIPSLIPFDRTRRDSGFYFVDHLDRDARTLAGIPGLTASSYTIRSTINGDLQRKTEAALQEGLARYELNTGRQKFTKAETNLRREVERIAKAGGGPSAEPAWKEALRSARLPLYDVRWTPAIVVDGNAGRKDARGTIRVGLADGRILPLTTWSAAERRALSVHDVVRVRVVEGRGKAGPRAELRIPPSVQGAALALENKTGRILAMAGGFSYPSSQLNRTTQAHRQPGSAFKPLTYLAALATGLQPNTLVWDSPVTLPPIGGSGDFWSPRNYDRGASGITTLRRALENSKNLVTAHLLEGGISHDPERSLSRVCDLALEAQIYVECVPHYPFVLGAQPLRLIDLAAFYAAIANEGARPSPYSVESVQEGGREIYRRRSSAPIALGSADRAAFFQLKTILQGVLERGTARTLKDLAPYVAGKTGTSDNENDAWFVAFTNDVTVAVWVGYDNADGKRRTLGRGQTGAKVALPIAESILKASWEHHAPRTPLAPPSPQAARQLIALKIDLRTGDRITDDRQGFTEYFRLSRQGQLVETQFRIVPREQFYAYGEPFWDGQAQAPYDRGDPYRESPYARAPGWFEPAPPPSPYIGVPWWEEEQPRRRPRRVDPDYRWGGDQAY